MVQRAALTLLRELAYGASADTCWVLNKNDPGLLRSLDRLSAQAASTPGPGGGASIAAHADHLRYGFELLNRYTRGENPYDSADWAASWRGGTVSEQGWGVLRQSLADEIEQSVRFLEQPRELSELEVTGILAIVAHLGYHLGAMRQIDRSLRGPSAEG